jgi:hypothetical protein
MVEIQGGLDSIVVCPSCDPDFPGDAAEKIMTHLLVCRTCGIE